MEIWRPVLVVVVSSVLASFTDWFFMGVLFHDRYDIHPEVWREGRQERSKILWSQVIGVLSCAGLVGLFFLGRPVLRDYLKVDLLVWFAAVVPITAQNTLWMKLNPLVSASHAVGWLVRFGITAVVAGFFLYRV